MFLKFKISIEKERRRRQIKKVGKKERDKRYVATLFSNERFVTQWHDGYAHAKFISCRFIVTQKRSADYYY